VTTTATAPAPAAGRARRLVRSGTTWEVVAVVAFTLWIAWPFLAPGGYVTDYDTVRYSGPNLAVTYQAWSEHRLPLWEPGIFGGTAFAGNLQTAVFAPVKLLFWPLGAPAAMGAITAAHLFLLAFGMWFLARRTLRLAPPAGLVAAAVMVGSGTTMVRAVRFEQIAVVAWIPWLLAAVDAVVAAPPGRRPAWPERRSRARPIAAGAAATAMVLLSGHPNQALIGAGLAAVWTLVRIRDRIPRHRADRAVRGGDTPAAALGRVAAAVGLGLAISAVALVLAVPLLRHLAVPPEVMLEEASLDRYTLWPSRLVSAFLGDATATSGSGDGPTLETPVFVGVAALLLAAAGTVSWLTGAGTRSGTPVGEGRNRATALGLIGAGLVGVVLALGPAFGAYRVAAAVVPGFGNGRVPVRCLFVTTVAVALLAAAGVSALVTGAIGTGPTRRRSAGAVGVTAAVVAFSALGPPWGAGAPTAGARAGWVVVLAAAGALAVMVARPGAPRWRVAGALAAAVVVIELGLPAAGSYARLLRTERSFADRATAVDDFLAAQGDRAMALGRGTVNANLTAGWRTFDGYDGGLWITDSYVTAAQRLDDRPFRPRERVGEQVRRPHDAGALARVGVRYVVIDPAADGRAVVAGWSGPVATDAAREVWENPRFRGEAVLVPAGPVPAGIGEGAPVPVGRPEPGAIDVPTAALPAGGRVVVAEQALPGWSATVDGVDVALVDVDGFSLAADVPPGAREVRFRYRPPGFVAGAAVSLAAVAAALGLALRRPRPGRH
jgi:hypothetical protein